MQKIKVFGIKWREAIMINGSLPKDVILDISKGDLFEFDKEQLDYYIDGFLIDNFYAHHDGWESIIELDTINKTKSPKKKMKIKR